MTLLKIVEIQGSIIKLMKPKGFGIYFKLGLLIAFVAADTITTLVGIPYLITYANDILLRSLSFVGSDLTDIKLISGIIVFALVAVALERFIN